MQILGIAATNPHTSQPIREIKRFRIPKRSLTEAARNGRPRRRRPSTAERPAETRTLILIPREAIVFVPNRGVDSKIPINAVTQPQIRTLQI